jgi:hypothetical protein
VVHVRDDQVPAGAQHASELGQYRLVGSEQPAARLIMKLIVNSC